MPTGDIGGEYNALNTAINQGKTNDDSGLRVFPANFVYSGSVDENEIFNRGQFGAYWSSTGDGDGWAYFAQHDNSTFITYPMGEWPGLSVRCLLKTN